jgi:hypothetical protein
MYYKSFASYVTGAVSDGAKISSETGQMAQFKPQGQGSG